MSHLLDDDDDLPRRRGDREVTLSTGAILGIFFGLTLVCGFFFAFGYNMGHKASPALVATSADSTDNYTSASAAYSSSKPSAGSPVSQPVASSTAGSTDNVVGPPHSAVQLKPEAFPVATPVPPETAIEQTTPTAQEPSIALPAHNTPGVAPGGTFVVQVAAVSHQEDADLLVSSLQKKGYAVAARNEAGDKLVHVQVGPFNNHSDADAMKLRLQGDGFHAMIKQL